MFVGGSIWKPPPMNFYTMGMPEELIAEEDLLEPNKGALSVAQRDRLEEIIHRLTPERTKVVDAMIFCIEHADAAEEIAECICESLTNPTTLPHKKIARIYLVSDILHNCSVKVQNASFFRRAMESQLPEMFKGLHSAYMSLESRLKAEGYKIRVLQVIKAWEDWAIYSRDFLTRLRKIFLGTAVTVKSPEPDEEAPVPSADNDIDGIPIEENDDDGDLPLDGASLLKRAMLTAADSSPLHKLNIYDDDDFDIDGVPIDDLPTPAMHMLANQPFEPAFVPSKWETVDPEQIEAQAITTSKWEQMAGAADTPLLTTEAISSESESESPDDDERRTRLREVEMKVMEFQDELESGRRDVRSGYTIQEEIVRYRKKLIKKSKKSEAKKSAGGSSLDTPDHKFRREQSSPEQQYQKKSKRSRRSPSPYAVRAVSPKARSPKRRRSRSPRYQSPSVSRKKYDSPRRIVTRESPPRRYRSPSPPSSRYSSSSSSSHKSMKHKRKY